MAPGRRFLRNGSSMLCVPREVGPRSWDPRRQRCVAHPVEVGAVVGTRLQSPHQQWLAVYTPGEVGPSSWDPLQWWAKLAPGKVRAVICTPAHRILGSGSSNGSVPHLPLESKMSAMAHARPWSSYRQCRAACEHAEKEAPMVGPPLSSHAPQQWSLASGGPRLLPRLPQLWCPVP